MRSHILILSIFGFLILPQYAHAVADFSGHWVANSGTVSSTVGLSSKCSKVEIVITQSANEIKTEKYEATCALYGSKWGPIVQTIKGGKVFETHDGDEEEVGTIDSDTMITVSQDGSTQYAYNLKLVMGPNGQPILRTYYGAKTAFGAMVTEADLSKVP